MEELGPDRCLSAILHELRCVLYGALRSKLTPAPYGALRSHAYGIPYCTWFLSERHVAPTYRIVFCKLLIYD